MFIISGNNGREDITALIRLKYEVYSAQYLCNY